MPTPVLYSLGIADRPQSASIYGFFRSGLRFGRGAAKLWRARGGESPADSVRLTDRPDYLLGM